MAGGECQLKLWRAQEQAAAVQCSPLPLCKMETTEHQMLRRKFREEAAAVQGSAEGGGIFWERKLPGTQLETKMPKVSKGVHIIQCLGL